VLKTGEEDIAGFFYLDSIRPADTGAERWFWAVTSWALKTL